MSTTPDTTDVVEVLPPITEASPDLFCWLWAAFPPRDGRIHVATAAEGLGVSQSTIRRWLKHARDLEWTPPTLQLLQRRANLRGHGDYLWPPLDDASRRRRDALTAQARIALETLEHEPESLPLAARLPYVVYQVHYPAARVFGLAAGRTNDTPRKLRSHGVIISEWGFTNRYAARLAIYTALEMLGNDNVIPPRTLLPVGRTQTWLQRVGSLSRAVVGLSAPGDNYEGTFYK